MTRHFTHGGISDFIGGSMSQPERVTYIGGGMSEADFEQPELTITFPRAKETYKVTSPPLKTDLALAPRMKVKVTGYGYLAKIKGDFLGDENKREWTVVLDEVQLGAE